MTSDVVHALAVIGALCLFSCAVFLVLLLTAEDDERSVHDPETVRLQRRCMQLEANWRHVTRQRDVLAEEVQLLNEALTEQVRAGHVCDPHELVAWRVN